MNFEDRFYTYINQIFGDGDVREIFTEVYPNDIYCLLVVDDKAHGHHHIVKETKTNRIICSKTTRPRIQNTYADVNDVLCQSYSLARYRDIPITRDKIQKQFDIIQMYRMVLQDDEFVNKINNELLENPLYKPYWVKYKNNQATRQRISLNKQRLLQNINALLDDWERYGYHHFIGKGI